LEKQQAKQKEMEQEKLFAMQTAQQTEMRAQLEKQVRDERRVKAMELVLENKLLAAEAKKMHSETNRMFTTNSLDERYFERNFGTSSR
jgi:hypothetical protein